MTEVKEQIKQRKPDFSFKDMKTGREVSFYQSGREITAIIRELNGSEQIIPVSHFPTGFISGFLSGMSKRIMFVDKDGKKWKFKVSSDDVDRFSSWLQRPIPLRDMLPDDLADFLAKAESQGKKYETLILAEEAQLKGKKAKGKEMGVLVGICGGDLLLCRQNTQVNNFFSDPIRVLSSGSFTVTKGSGDDAYDYGIKFGSGGSVCACQIRDQQDKVFVINLPTEDFSILAEISSGQPVVSSTDAEEAIDRKAKMFKQMGFEVGGVEEAKESVRDAEAARPNEAWFDEAVNELVSLYLAHGECFSEDDLEVHELRRIGEMLDKRGGIDLMRAAHAEFVGRCDIRGAGRNLEYRWDGIGRWLG